MYPHKPLPPPNLENQIWVRKDQRFLQLHRNEFNIKLLQNNNPFIVFSPNHPFSEDELKQIDMGYNQGLAKENIMSQPLNRMYGS